MKHKRRLPALVLLILTLTVFLPACSQEPRRSGPTINITDSVGRSIDLPEHTSSICCVCPFSGPIVVMLGAGDKLTSICHNMARSYLLNMICPSLENCVIAKSNGSINAEEILRLGTDLIFIDRGTYLIDDERAKLDNMGIPYVVVGYDDLSSQSDAIMVIGRALSQEEKAQAYVDWCESIYSDIRNIQNKPSDLRLYHAVNEAVRTDLADSICAEWISYTGVSNVSINSELTQDGDKSYTTLEQIYLWDPDLIICNEAGVPSYILTDPKWAGLRCVREGQVYQVPVGIARMGHPTSTETPLALIWLENLVNPSQYQTDYHKILKDYYKNFYDYEIDDQLANAIIEGSDMRDPNSVKPN